MDILANDYFISSCDLADKKTMVNRTIKFRAWDKREKKFVGLLSLTEYGTEDSFATQHDSLVWQQFTGLTDKNRKEIYEGDILGYWGEASWRVGFIDGEFCTVYHNISVPFQIDQKAFRLSRKLAAQKKIIGNIWEDANLLQITERV